MKVLFVCTGNSFRSPVSEAMMKKLRRDLDVESAGIQPAHRIASNARRLLEREDAALYLKKTPEGIDAKKLEKYDLIIVMEDTHKTAILQRHPQVREKIKIWDIGDPIYLPPGADEEVFNEIKQRAEELARSI
jgi:protein-tyrosine-phosphatase